MTLVPRTKGALMKNLIALFCCVALLATSSMAAEDKPEERIPGIWVLSGMVVNGKAIEDDDLGKRIIVFTEDGTMAAFEDEDAFKSFEPDDAGRYQLGEDQTIIFYEDRNENEKLDKHERERAETMNWSMDEEKFVLSITMKRGEEEMVLQTVLEPYQNGE